MLTMEAQRVRMCARAGHVQLREDLRLRVNKVADKVDKMLAETAAHVVDGAMTNKVIGAEIPIRMYFSAKAWRCHAMAETTHPDSRVHHAPRLSTEYGAVSYTHLTLPTIYSV